MKWVWSVAFKRRGEGPLLWIDTTTQDVMEASRQARAIVDKRYPGKGYLEYGHSKTNLGRTRP